MQRVRLRHLSFPLAFLLPILLVAIGTQNDPSTAHRQRAALTQFTEPSPEIEAALSAERRRIIDEAETVAADERTRAQKVAEAEVAAAIEAKAAQDAAEAQAAAETRAAEEWAAAKAARAQAVAQYNAEQAAKAKAEAARAKTQAQVKPEPVVQSPTPRTGTGSMPPDYIKQCESGGNYSAVNSNGHYGAWQFSQGTWNSVGGTGRPDQASPAEQDYRASILWDNGAGAGHWACA